MRYMVYEQRENAPATHFKVCRDLADAHDEIAYRAERKRRAFGDYYAAMFANEVVKLAPMPLVYLACFAIALSVAVFGMVIAWAATGSLI